MNLNIHIERLILEGLPIRPGQRAMVQAAVEAELSQLLSEGGLAHDLQSNVALPGVKADAIQGTGNHPNQLGQQIARSVYSGIGHAK
jgi:hypothetical protein